MTDCEAAEKDRSASLFLEHVINNMHCMCYGQCKTLKEFHLVIKN